MAEDELKAALVPELDVADLPSSMVFYVELLGFRVLFEREAERFAYLALDGAELMLQEAAGPGRRFRTAPLERPFGRGVNYQLAVADVDVVYERVLAAGYEPLLAMEERWYQVDVVVAGGRWVSAGTGPTEAGNRQFVVADPDGYLWRPFTDLGVRPISAGPGAGG
jgi:catechol 2,3-dioxygenase-like lactoylglutathione lyase family enzyme